MINIQLDPPKERKKSPLIYVGIERAERWRAIAGHYGHRMVDVFDKVLDALEADLAERKEKP